MMARSILSAAAAALLTVSSQAWAGPDKTPACKSDVPARWAGRTTTWRITVDGQTRSFNVHLPSSFRKNRPSDLVINYPTYGTTAELWEFITNFSATAEQHGFVVVYPEPLSTEFENLDGSLTALTTWNDHLGGSGSPGPAGPTCDLIDPDYELPIATSCLDDPHRDACNWADCQNDDIGFSRAMLKELERRLCINPDRIYTLGASNSATMAERLVCQFPEKFAALAMVVGRPSIGYGCTAVGEKVALMQVNGRIDVVVPPDGSPSFDGLTYLSVDRMEDLWAGVASQSCDDSSSIYGTGGVGNLNLACTQRDNCQTGAQVVQCALDQGHQWPSDPPRPSPPPAGNRFMNEVIWDFFDRNPKN